MNAEWLFCGLLVAAAILPLIRKLRPRPVWVWGIVLAVAACTVIATLQWTRHLSQISRESKELRATIPRPDRSEDFLASGSCQSCHPSQYARWHQSYHRTMTQVASRETVRGNFDQVSLAMMGQTYGLLKAIRSHQIDSPSVENSKRTGRPNACNLCHLDRSLGWTAKHLSDWYSIPAPSLTEEEQSVSAAVSWLLKGDAGQRALIAWSMGWREAQLTSGQHWLAPYLAQLLEDPYAAVRYIAFRSLRRVPGYRDFAYDYIGSAPHRAGSHQRALELWKKQSATELSPAMPEVLMGPNHELQQDSFDRLLRLRDDHYMDLQE